MIGTILAISKAVNYEPLHHKYRPQTFADLVGQEAIAATLTNALTSKRIAPAYLFTGSRGTGKTSSARILAKSLNCLAYNEPTPKPCGKCDVCRGIAQGVAMDVIEIDAASNTGVDNIREIIEKSHFAPVQCRYKVYAIDEVHGLTNQAFNALLKTLEEPPEKVVFILATTDPQRVLPTIISRCQRFDFRRIPLEAMVAHLLWIAQQERIDITEEAVRLVAQISQGGLRDAESLLDQLSLLKDGVTAEKVWDLVGAVSEIDLLAMVQAIAAGDPESIINRARNLMDRGKEPTIVLQNLGGFYRDLLIAKTAPQNPALVALTPDTWQQLVQEAHRWSTEKILAGSKYLRDSEVQIKNTTQPRLWLEVTLLGLLLPDQSGVMPLLATTVITAKVPHGQSNPVGQVPNAPNGNGHNHPVTDLAPALATPLASSDQAPPEVSSPVVQEPEVDEMLETWQEVVEHIPMYSTQAFLKQHCQLLDFDGVVATIGVTNENLANTARRKQEEIETAFAKICSRKVVVNLAVAGKKEAQKNLQNSQSSSNTSGTSTPSVQEQHNTYTNGSGHGSDRSNGNGNGAADLSRNNNGYGNGHNGSNNGNNPNYANGHSGNGHNGNGQVASRSLSPTAGATIAPPAPSYPQITSPASPEPIKEQTNFLETPRAITPAPNPPALASPPENIPNLTLAATPIELPQEMPENDDSHYNQDSLAALQQVSSFFDGEIITLDGVF